MVQEQEQVLTPEIINREQASDMERMKSSDTSFEDTLRAAYRFDLLRAFRTEILQTAKGETPNVTPTAPEQILNSIRSGALPSAQ